MNTLLAKLGLNNQEASIYQALLEHGHLSVSGLAEHAGLYRPQIYKSLPRLIEKNLVSQSRYGRRKIYMAQSPRQLGSIVDTLRLEVEASMPDLLHLYATSQTKPIVRYFEGVRGIRHVYEDMVATCKKGDIIYRYESPQNYRAIHKYVPAEYLTRFRDQGEVERFIITNNITYQQKKKRLGRLVKGVPAKYDLFVYDISQIIYNNKVAFIDFRSETAVLIENPLFAEFQRKIFKLLFDKL